MDGTFKKSLPKYLNSKISDILSTTGLNKNTPLLSGLADEELVKCYKNGEAQAFRALLNRYEKPLFNFILRFLGNHQVAEEAFQEVFLRVIRSVNDYRPSAKFSTWLYTIARNYCIDLSRKQRFRRHLSLEETGSSELDSSGSSLLATEADAEEITSTEELEKILYGILEQLNPEQREVFLLRETQGLQFDEIAKMTKVSTNTVKSRMRYALQAIQKKFSDLNIEGENIT